MTGKAYLFSAIMTACVFITPTGTVLSREIPETDTLEQTVTGIVKDRTGNPVVGAQVAALPMSDRYVLTDAEGRFEISWKRKWEPRSDVP